MASSAASDRRLRRLPQLVRLEAALAAMAEEDSDAILATARALLDDDGAIEALVGPMVASARADPFYRPGLRTASGEVNHALVLWDQPRLTILLGTIGPDALAAKRTFGGGPASITFDGQVTLFRFLRAGGATLSFWEAPAIGPGFTAAASGRCRRVGRRRIEDGETLAVDGRRQSFVIDHAVADIVYLHASTPAGAAPLAVAYDSASLVMAGASATDESGSRIQMMLSLLRAMDRRDSAPAFAEALRASQFHARWQAMRELLALDAGLALPHLREMAAADPHPEVREAAARTLAAFFAEPAEPCPA